MLKGLCGSGEGLRARPHYSSPSARTAITGSGTSSPPLPSARTAIQGIHAVPSKAPENDEDEGPWTDQESLAGVTGSPTRTDTPNEMDQVL